MLKQSHHLKWLNAVYSGEMVKCHESESLLKLTYFSTFP